jgi:hypothetical protein
MQSPAPVAKKITGRTNSGDRSGSSVDIIENIEAITSNDLEDKDKKKKAVDHIELLARHLPNKRDSLSRARARA